MAEPNPHLKPITQKKIKAVKLMKDKGLSIREASKVVGINRATLTAYISKIINNYKRLSPEARVSYWEHESLKHGQLASVIRDILMSAVETSPSSVSMSEKRAIYYSAAMCAGLAHDKAHPKAEVQVNIGIKGEIDRVSAGISALERKLHELDTQDMGDTQDAGGTNNSMSDNDNMDKSLINNDNVDDNGV